MSSATLTSVASVESAASAESAAKKEEETRAMYLSVHFHRNQESSSLPLGLHLGEHPSTGDIYITKISPERLLSDSLLRKNDRLLSINGGEPCRLQGLRAVKGTLRHLHGTLTTLMAKNPDGVPNWLECQALVQNDEESAVGIEIGQNEQGHFVIAAIQSSSLFADSPLMVGNRCLAINGIPVSNDDDQQTQASTLSLESVQEMLHTEKTAGFITLRVQRDEFLHLPPTTAAAASTSTSTSSSSKRSHSFSHQDSNSSTSVQPSHKKVKATVPSTTTESSQDDKKLAPPKQAVVAETTPKVPQQEAVMAQTTTEKVPEPQQKAADTQATKKVHEKPQQETVVAKTTQVYEEPAAEQEAVETAEPPPQPETATESTTTPAEAAATAVIEIANAAKDNAMDAVNHILDSAAAAVADTMAGSEPVGSADEQNTSTSQVETESVTKEADNHGLADKPPQSDAEKESDVPKESLLPTSMADATPPATQGLDKLVDEHKDVLQPAGKEAESSTESQLPLAATAPATILSMVTEDAAPHATVPQPRGVDVLENDGNILHSAGKEPNSTKEPQSLLAAGSASILSMVTDGTAPLVAAPQSRGTDIVENDDKDVLQPAAKEAELLSLTTPASIRSMVDDAPHATASQPRGTHDNLGIVNDILQAAGVQADSSKESQLLSLTTSTSIRSMVDDPTPPATAPQSRGIQIKPENNDKDMPQFATPGSIRSMVNDGPPATARGIDNDRDKNILRREAKSNNRDVLDDDEKEAAEDMLLWVFTVPLRAYLDGFGPLLYA